MRDLLTGQLKQQMEAKKDQLLELEEHDVVCKWIIDYTRAWEEVYHKSRGDHTTFHSSSSPQCTRCTLKSPT